MTTHSRSLMSGIEGTHPEYPGLFHRFFHQQELQRLCVQAGMHITSLEVTEDTSVDDGLSDDFWRALEEAEKSLRFGSSSNAQAWASEDPKSSEKATDDASSNSRSWRHGLTPGRRVAFIIAECAD